MVATGGLKGVLGFEGELDGCSLKTPPTLLARAQESWKAEAGSKFPQVTLY